jgi:O-antigen ligase
VRAARPNGEPHQAKSTTPEGLNTSALSRLGGISHGWMAPAVAGLAGALGLGAVYSPLFVVAATLGVAFVVVAFRSLIGGLVLFTILIFFEQITALTGSGVTFAKLGGVVLAGSWLIHVIKRERATAVLAKDHPLLGFLGVLLVVWTFCSLLWAVDVGVAAGDAFQVGQEMLFLFIVYSAITEPRHLRWLLWAFIGGATSTALVGLTVAPAPDLYSVPGAARVSGGVGDPNYLAAFLVAAIVFGVFMFAAERGVVSRWLSMSSIVICSLALFRTQSRGGIVASGVVLVVALVLSGPVRFRALAVVSTIAAFGIFYFTLVAPPQALARISEFRADEGSHRVELWTVATHVFRDHPVFGVGAGNFRVVEPAYSITDINLRTTDVILDRAEVVHNTYLHVLAETGLIGLALFVSVIVATLTMGVRAINAFSKLGDLEMEILTRGLAIGSIGMLVAFVFLSAQHEKQLPLLLGALAAVYAISRRSFAEVRSTREIETAPLRSLEPLAPSP